MNRHGYIIHAAAIIMAVAIVTYIVLPAIGRMMDAAAALRAVTG